MILSIAACVNNLSQETEINVVTFDEYGYTVSSDGFDPSDKFAELKLVKNSPEVLLHSDWMTF